MQILFSPGLPLGDNRDAYEALLAEVVFGQLLRAPHPELRPVAYNTIMVRHTTMMSLIWVLEVNTLKQHCGVPGGHLQAEPALPPCDERRCA